MNKFRNENKKRENVSKMMGNHHTVLRKIYNKQTLIDSRENMNVRSFLYGNAYIAHSFIMTVMTSSVRINSLKMNFIQSNMFRKCFILFIKKKNIRVCHNSNNKSVGITENWLNWSFRKSTSESKSTSEEMKKKKHTERKRKEKIKLWSKHLPV